MDIAASVQKITEDIILKIAKNLRNEYGLENLCLADVVHRRHVERFQQREGLFVGAVDVGGAAEEGLGRESN